MPSPYGMHTYKGKTLPATYIRQYWRGSSRGMHNAGATHPYPSQITRKNAPTWETSTDQRCNCLNLSKINCWIGPHDTTYREIKYFSTRISSCALGVRVALAPRTYCRIVISPVLWTVAWYRNKYNQLTQSKRIINQEIKLLWLGDNSVGHRSLWRVIRKVNWSFVARTYV